MEEIMLITGIVLVTSACLYAGLIGLFTFGWYRKNDEFDQDSKEQITKVSVIVAARNEEKHIADLLSDLAEQDYPASLLEVVVVDDHSEDHTIEIVRNILEEKKYEGFKLVDLATTSITDGFTRQPGSPNANRSGKKAAITAGISKANGEIIIVTDADCRMGPAWVSSMVSYFKDAKKMMVFGPVAIFPGKGLLNLFQSLEFSGLVASGAGAAMAGKPFMCNGANLAYRKGAFLKMNGYEGNEKFISGDDVFLMHKIKEEFGNKSISFAKNINAIVRTYPTNGLRAFFRQRIRWASKTKGYRDKLATFTAITVFLFNFLISAAFFAGFFSPILFLLYFYCMLLKTLIDIPLIYGITGFNNERRLMVWYLPFQLVYPFYVVSAGVCSMFSGKKW